MVMINITNNISLKKILIKIKFKKFKFKKKLIIIN